MPCEHNKALQIYGYAATELSTKNGTLESGRYTLSIQT